MHVSRISRRAYFVTVGLLFLAATGASLLVTWAYRYQLEARLLDVSAVAAAAVNHDRIHSVTRNPSVSNPDYLRLKEQLTDIYRSVHSLSLRWVYLIAKNPAGEIVFLADSAAESDPGYSPPGTVYRQPPPDFANLFTDPTSRVFGPYTDEYGQYISASASVVDYRHGGIIALAVVDKEYSVYLTHVLEVFVAAEVLFTGLAAVMALAARQYFHLRNLNHQLDLFRQAVENANDQIVITDTDGFVLYANRAMEKITGYTVTEAAGQKAGKLWGGLMPKDYYDTLWQTIKQQKQPFLGEFINVRKSGVKYYAAASISPILNKSGRVINFVAIERDMTQEREIDKLKDELISVASHELRTPMTAIRGFASMLLDGDYGRVPAKFRSPLVDIMESTERLIRLVNDLLNVSRIESGRMRYDLSEFGLKEVVEGTISQLSPLAADKGLAMACANHKTCQVFSDPAKIRQTLNNLIGNALKFTDTGSITISCAPDAKNPDLLNLYVTDTGMGIAPEYRDKIFGKFEQVTSAQSGRPPGTGLGLYIAREVMRKLGGNVWLEKSAPGQGSTFGFSVVLAGTPTAKKIGEQIAAEARANPDQKPLGG